MQYAYGIIDSNAASFLQLDHFLSDLGEMQCVAHDADSKAGLNSILKYKPDVVFINLQECAQDSFAMVRDLYQYLQHIPLFIGFSGTKEHAYEALKHQFFDYWVLPFDEFDIRKTLLKLGKRLPKPEVAPTICLQSYKDYQYLPTDEILYLKADNNATDFIMRDGSRISAFRTLKSFEQQLPANFVRIHQSYILNGDFISRINYGKNRCTLKFGKAELPFSRGYRPNVDALKNLLSEKSLSGNP